MEILLSVYRNNSHIGFNQANLNLLKISGATNRKMLSTSVSSISQLNLFITYNTVSTNAPSIWCISRASSVDSADSIRSRFTYHKYVKFFSLLAKCIKLVNVDTTGSTMEIKRNHARSVIHPL